MSRPFLEVTLDDVTLDRLGSAAAARDMEIEQFIIELLCRESGRLTGQLRPSASHRIEDVVVADRSA
jgi:hypothetical protein